jgi:hypothetical protein
MHAALSESATVDTSDKETVVGGCMLWYTRKLLATLEEHLSSAGEGLVAGTSPLLRCPQSHLISSPCKIPYRKAMITDCVTMPMAL